MNQKTTQDRIEEALKKVRALRECRDRLAASPSMKLSRGEVRQMVELLDGIERRTNRIMEVATKASNDILAIGQKVRAESSEKKQSGGLAGLVGKMGSGILNGVTDIIENAAVPITKSVLDTAKKVTDTVVDSSLHIADDITKSATKTAGSIVDGASNISASLIQQTSNLANSLTKTTVDSLGKIGDRAMELTTGKDVKSMARGVLSGIGDLVSSTATKASGILGGAKTTAHNLLGKAGTTASNLVNGVSDIVGSIGTQGESGKGLLGSIQSVAGGLLGSAASSLCDSIFGKSNSSSPSGKGLFGAALDAATSTATVALDLASGIAGGLTKGVTGAASSIFGGLMGDDAKSALGGGLSGLAGGLLAGAASAVSSIASAGINAVGDMIGDAADAGSGLLGAAGDVASSMLSTASNVGSGLLDAVGDVAGGLFDTAGGLIDGAGDVLSGLANFAGDALGAAEDLATGTMDAALGLAGDVVDTAANLAGDALDLAGDIAGGVMDAAVGVVDGVMDAVFGESDELTEDMFDDFSDIYGDLDYMDDEYDGEDIEGAATTNDEPQEGDPTDSSYWEKLEGAEGQTSDGTDDENGGDGTAAEDSTTPTSQTTEDKSYTMQTTESDDKSYGWRTIKNDIPKDAVMMMHDGDQQLFNPFGPRTGDWTMYSFRPKDTLKSSNSTSSDSGSSDGSDGSQNSEPFPQIAITPASFEAISSINTMLDNIPFIVVKEFFFKNTASMMMDFVKKIMDMTAEVKNKINQVAPAAGETVVSRIKDAGNMLLEQVKNTFQNISLKDAVIDIPYNLYCCLRQRVYGNTYVFPYLVQQSTVINSSSNESEWGNAEDGGGGLIGMLKGAFQNIAELAGGVAAGLAGSQAKVANLFPAPIWNGAGSDKVQFQFDLILINDNVLKARNNYMCVNTIIHNNRSIQKAILAFPGALYEIWLPTGQRHLMCTGDFQLFPLGLNRKVPKGFFDPFTDNPIGVPTWKVGAEPEGEHGAEMQQEHQDTEVIPDAYKLQIRFKSCLANNMNTAVFQYYVKMTGYDDYDKAQMGGDVTPPPVLSESVNAATAGREDGNSLNTLRQSAEDGGQKTTVKNATGPNDNDKKTPGVQLKKVREFQELVSELVEGEGTEDETGSPIEAEINPDDYELDVQTMQMSAQTAASAKLNKDVETFEESTYNKKLERIKSYLGDRAMNAESVIQTVRNANRVTRLADRFLGKLYNAESGNLWYRPFEQDEIYTTIDADYRQILRKQYGQSMAEIRSVDAEIKAVESEMRQISRELSTKTALMEREPILARKVVATKKMNALQKRKDAAVDKTLQIDADLINAAFDAHDRAVSVKKNVVTTRIFQQVWNEKIMNSYERDKLQYLTSEEKSRYFADKIRELRKYDVHGVLNHPDWFFRVVVLDYIVQEMKRLVYWFKNCAYDDFDTIYRIVRKLELLQLDVDAIHSKQAFSINHTNLFYISDKDAEAFTKLDFLLTGNTLYELFQNQVSLNFVQMDDADSGSGDESPAQVNDRKLVQEQESERKFDEQRTVRQDVVARNWGSETELTKAAYEELNKDINRKIGKVTFIDGGEWSAKDEEGRDKGENTTLKDLKDAIMELKLTGSNDETLLQNLLGAFAGQIAAVKEGMVIDAINGMASVAAGVVSTKDGSVNAKVVSC